VLVCHFFYLKLVIVNFWDSSPQICARIYTRVFERESLTTFNLIHVALCSYLILFSCIRLFMTETNKALTQDSIKKMLFIVVKMALQNGLTYREFTDLCKKMFVEVAAKDFGINGRPTNISRIALLTGMDRKEIKRIKDLLTSGDFNPPSERKQDRITRIISAWYQDEQYLTPSGKPRQLHRNGDSGTFSSLVKEYGGDVPEGAVYKELLRNKIIEVTPSGRIKILKRTFVPDKSDPESMVRAATVLQDIGSALIHNLYEAHKKKQSLRFERRATNHSIKPSQIEAFRAFLEEEGQAFLERADAWLSEHETDESDDSAVRLGVGAYMIESPIVTTLTDTQNDQSEE